MKREPTPLNDRYNTMPKYRGFGRGNRKMGDSDPWHGTVKTVYNRDFPGAEGTFTCSHCRGAFRTPKHDACPHCLAPFEPPKH